MAQVVQVTVILPRDGYQLDQRSLKPSEQVRPSRSHNEHSGGTGGTTDVFCNELDQDKVKHPDEPKVIYQRRISD